MDMTTKEKTDKLPPLEKITTLVNDLDQLRFVVQNQVKQNQSLDELIDYLYLDELSDGFGLSAALMRKRLLAAGAKIFKLGKRYAIRKVGFLEVIERLEQD